MGIFYVGQKLWAINPCIMENGANEGKPALIVSKMYENKLDNGDKESEDKNLQQGYKERLKQYILYLRGMGNDQKKALYTNTALINKFWEIHDFLEEYEGFLRSVLHRKGLLLKMEKDPTKASIDL